LTDRCTGTKCDPWAGRLTPSSRDCRGLCRLIALCRDLPQLPRHGRDRREGWPYLATVIDCHTKAVIGWATDNNYKTPLISAAIEMAARNHDLAPGAISSA
jgi:transposase InsO family protein